MAEPQSTSGMTLEQLQAAADRAWHAWLQAMAAPLRQARRRMAQRLRGLR